MKKKFSKILGVGLTLALLASLLLTATPVAADASVNQGFGAVTISADTALDAPGTATTDLNAANASDLILVFDDADFLVATKTLQLNAPDGLDFIAPVPDIAIAGDGAGTLAFDAGTITDGDIVWEVATVANGSGSITLTIGGTTPTLIQPEADPDTSTAGGEITLTGTAGDPDLDTSPITSGISAITVEPGAVTQMLVQPVDDNDGDETSGTATTTLVAGEAFGVRLTLQDQFGNTASNYTDTTVDVQWISTADDAPDTTSPTLPAVSTLDFTAGTAGVAEVADFTLTKAETGINISAELDADQDATFDDPVAETASAALTVEHGLLLHFLVETENTVSELIGEVAGTPFNVTLTAQDQFDNTADSYAGNHDINFTSTATAAPDGTTPTIPTAPDSISFGSGIGNSAASGFTLVNVSETPTIFATDGAIEGTSAAILVEGYNLDSEGYRTGEPVLVTVNEQEENESDLAAEVMQVVVMSDTSDPATTLVSLTETGIATGIFEGTFDLVGTSPGSGELLVSTGDTIIVDEGETLAITPLNQATVDDVSPVFTSVTGESYYKDGDEISLEVELDSAGYTVTADFSNIDSEYTADDVTVAPAGATYTVTYTISADDNTIADGEYVIPVTATDVAGNSATDSSFYTTLDNTLPVVDNEMPADESFIDDSTPLFSIEVTDSSIEYENWTMIIDAPVGNVTADLSITPITDGYLLEYLVPSANEFSEGTYNWAVTAADLAGNEGTAEFSFTYDASAPTLDAAVTGWTWDAEAGEAGEPADTDSTTSIMVTFSEDLNEATVAGSDFLVDGLETPSAVDVQGVNVFLTVAEMDTDATPSVELVGEVSDLAGNAQTVGEIEEAVDNIDPILTVAVDPELGMDETEITITVTSSEALVADPTVNVTDPEAAPLVLDEPGMVSTDTTTWEGTYTLDEANLDGVYAVTAGGTDMAANDALGVADAITGEAVGTGDATETVFTLDNAPVVGDSQVIYLDGAPQTETTHYTFADATGEITFLTAPAADVAITADYSYFAGAAATFEGDFTPPTVVEFVPADGEDVPTTSPWINIEFSEDVEEFEVTLDEVDVTEEFYAVGEGQNTYMLATTDLAMGDHTISVLATDLAGNEMEEPETATFTVTVPPPFSIELFPGWNLISLPLIPDDSSIEAVLGDAIVDSVWAYEPTYLTDGIDNNEDGTIDEAVEAWLSYSPEEPSDLTEMRDGRGYWVSMTAPATLTVSGIIMPAPPSVPPTYPVVAGWNLIGFKSTASYTVDLYLTNTVPTVVWQYQNGDYSVPIDMYPGQGYWVWFHVGGTIVPQDVPLD